VLGGARLCPRHQLIRYFPRNGAPRRGRPRSGQLQPGCGIAPWPPQAACGPATIGRVALQQDQRLEVDQGARAGRWPHASSTTRA
jgi:hypothetical protein